AVDQAGDEGLLLARPAFALEVAAGDLAGREGLFLVIDGQREEIETGLRLLHGDDGGQHDGLAIGGQHSAIGLTGDLAGLQDERTSAPFDFDFVMIEHVLSLDAGTRRADSSGAGSLASLQDEPRARQRDASLQWNTVWPKTGFPLR